MYDFLLTLGKPCQERSLMISLAVWIQYTPTAVFSTTTDPCQITARSVDIWKTGGRTTHSGTLCADCIASMWTTYEATVYVCDLKTDIHSVKQIVHVSMKQKCGV